ncbi:MAG: MraY family glycosyltransferase [Candidatus Methylacidiphilales bacterium]|nr:MraY family glycosyltransferase [Candidatus Methylacidiphilales bacterium]
MIIAAILGLVGILVALLVTPWVIHLGEKGWGLDRPDNYRKKHRQPVSRLGGVPVLFGFLIAVSVVFFFHPEYTTRWLPVLVTVVLMFGLGFWDDLRPLGARLKLFCQILIAVLAYCLGLSIESVTYPGSGVSVNLGALGFWVSIFWLISVPNIVNLIDGVDGLAAGLGALLLCTLGYVGWSMGQTDVSWVSFSLVGVLLGFLCFNFPPARIFLGDGGAYLIGSAVACLSLVSANKGAVAAVILVMMVALGLPIMDTLFALVRRAFRGFPLFHADAEHIHHRLQRLGLSERRVVLGLYLVSAIFSMVALSVLWSQGRTLPIVLGMLFLAMVLMVRYLGYIWSWADLASQVRRSIERRREVRYALLQASLMELEVERCQSLAEFRVVMIQALRRVGFVLDEHINQDRYLNVTLYFVHEESLVLQAPNDLRDSEHWRRLAECFRRPYMMALKRWQD